MKKLIPLLIGLILTSCSHRIKRPMQNSISIIDSFVTYNCFAENFGEYEVTGNIAIQKTSSGNFLKCTAFNDSQYIFSCGRENKEVILDTCNFHWPFAPRELDYDNDRIIILYTRTGSDNWMYDFVLPGYNKIYHSEAQYIDSINLRFVDIYPDTKTVSLIIHNMIDEQYNDTLKTNFYKLTQRQGGDPCLNIRDVKLDSNILTYSVPYEKARKTDTLYLSSCPCLK